VPRQGQGEAIVSSVGDFFSPFAKDEVDAEIGATFLHGFRDGGSDRGDEGGLATGDDGDSWEPSP
jgi:hypothetical protein